VKVVHFSEEKGFQLHPIEIKNNWGRLGKPSGGLWASPSSSQDSWEQWCHEESYGNIGSQTRVEMEVDTTNFITIDSAADLEKLPVLKIRLGKETTGPKMTIESIDFEQMVADGIDGVYLTDRGQWDTRFAFLRGVEHSLPLSLYGWDCECLLIMNEGCIKSYQVLRNRAKGLEKPIRNERAIDIEKPIKYERAKGSEKPKRRERANIQEKPKKKERATVLEKPRIKERAKKQEKPMKSERARNQEKPIRRERARINEQPMR